MPTDDTPDATASAAAAPAGVPRILRPDTRSYRGLNDLTWTAEGGLNVVLGGGNVGKSTILDAAGLLRSLPIRRRWPNRTSTSAASTPGLR